MLEIFQWLVCRNVVCGGKVSTGTMLFMGGYNATTTTGNRDFAECKILCRVSKIGHSAKNCTRQRFLCRVPGTRQTQALGKGLLCRVPDSRQNLYTRHRLPVKRRRATSFFAERLRLGTRQRFFFLISLPSAPDLALGKDFFLFF